MTKFYEFEQLTGEILSLDDALMALYEYRMEDEFSNVFIMPVVGDNVSDDITLSISYDVENDNFTDIFGCVIYKDSWIDDYDEWVLGIAH